MRRVGSVAMSGKYWYSLICLQFRTLRPRIATVNRHWQATTTGQTNDPLT